MLQPIDAVLFDMGDSLRKSIRCAGDDGMVNNQRMLELREVIIALFRRGYRLGLVSKTISSVEVTQMLNELKVSGCFQAVLLSCVEGTRKPDPIMLLEAAAQMRINPAHCAYVGDRVDGDVAAARRAGFGQTVLVSEQSDPAEQQVQTSEPPPDHFIDNLLELLERYPPRTPPVSQKMDVSLSTMWVRNNFPTLADFLMAAQRLGFAQVELNHDINSDMLSGIDFSEYSISSVHEPCPADISTRNLKRNDWLISSVDEENRARGVKSIERSINLAYDIGAPLVVVHAGQVTGDLSLEKSLRALIEDGQSDSAQAAVRAEMVQFREEKIELHFEAVKKSLDELLEYAHPRKVCLGLENRYHYTDIPTPHEMAILLEMASPKELGMVFDTGHAHVLQQLGLFVFEEWLERFSSRIVSVHLHDANCLTDHAVPGTGEVDFPLLTSYLPQNALKTFEIRGIHTSEQIETGLIWMVTNGWVKSTTSCPCEV